MISLEKVSFSYAQKKIFEDVNLAVSPGDFLWIKGRNGTGKTTLLRILLDFIKPSEGRVEIKKDLRIGWVPATDSGFFPRLTGLENLIFFAVLSGRELAIPQGLESDFCREVLSTPFQKMSSGMKQFLMLLRAGIDDPDLYLLDEPLRGLDNQNRDLILGHLDKLKASGKTIIMTGHQDGPGRPGVKNLEIRTHAII